jgi:hypothetical protein
LHQIGQCRRDEIFERRRAAIWARHLPFPAAEVREEVPDGDVLADRRITHTKVRDVRAHRRAEVDLPLLDESHHRRRDERLRDRRDRIDGVRVDRDRVLDVRNAEASDGRGAAFDDTKRDARHAILLHLRLGERYECVEAWIGCGLCESDAIERERDRRRGCEHDRSPRDE